MARVVFVIQREDIDVSRSVLKKVLFPIESAFAAALLVKYGHEVFCFDLNLMDNNACLDTEFKNYLEEINPDFVVSSPQMLTFLIKEKYDDTKLIFHTAKEYNKHIKTIYTGVFATSYPEEAIKRSGADYLVKGELEEPLLNIIDTKVEPPHRIIESPDTLDFGSLPFPVYKEFSYKEYFKYPGAGNLRYPEYSRRYTHYQTSRSCTCLCSFCNVSFLRGRRKYKTRPIDIVIKDLKTLVNDYDIEEIHFLDENLTLNKKRTTELCRRIIDEGIKFKWIASGGMSIYTLNEDVLKLLRESGCYRLNLALESGSQEVLDNIINKPVKLERDVPLLEIAKKTGFEIIGYFVIGLPGETKNQINETLKLASNPAFDYVTISIATPQAGTELEKMCIEKELIDKDKLLADVSRRSTGLFSTDEFSCFELEEIRWKEWDRINFSSSEKISKIAEMMGVTAAEIEKIRKDTMESFKKRWNL